MSVVDQLMTVAAAQVTQHASAQTGLTENATQKVVPMAMTAILSGLKKNAATPHDTCRHRHEVGICLVPPLSWGTKSLNEDPTNAAKNHGPEQASTNSETGCSTTLKSSQRVEQKTNYG